MFRKERYLLLLVLIFALVGCSSEKGEKVADDELGELAPSFTVLTATPEENYITYEAMKMISEEWKKLGVDVTVQPMDFHAKVDRLWAPDERDYDAFTIGYSGRVERLDPDMFTYTIFHSSLAGPGGSNTTGLVNEEYDKYSKDQRHEMDPEKRRDLVFKAQEILADEVPVVSLYSNTLVHAYNHERFNELPAMAGEGVFNEWMPTEAEPLTDDKWLKIGGIQDLDTLNPIAAKSVFDWRQLRQIYDKLVRLNPQIEPVPSAAANWEVVNDKTIDVFLRPNMTFHDGKPVTVEDVKFSYEFMDKWNDGYLQAFLEPIESIELLGGETIRFHLTEAYAPFITATLTQIPILPKHIWEKVEGNPLDFANLEPIGSGPFVFEYWRRGEELKVSRNPDYYNNINVDGYIYRVYGQPEAVLSALRTGEIDTHADRLISAHIQQAENIEHISTIEVADIGFEYLGLNLRRAPFDNEAFRQALALTIDYDTILDVYLEGYGTKGGPGLVIQPANEFWHNPAAHQPIFDPKKARDILREAGYNWDSEGKLRLPVN
ncbi:ABC transporter substrate-binding protein [Ammoniphilus oxalaticus]|uniref:ABC transporter substrate-binding protein n=1 Tax=Ammoniphilus oxalaticus TaxID=66863 RepID=A0A419SGE5_9BACL|nr:ABC transporter substrate-binding protein [Ammoniphilus oxalaticus]RKD22856.1 ABC transporter substrate-binding protein [Ammoniphilus oxalaticus]